MGIPEWACPEPSFSGKKQPLLLSLSPPCAHISMATLGAALRELWDWLLSVSLWHSAHIAFSFVILRAGPGDWQGPRAPQTSSVNPGVQSPRPLTQWLRVLMCSAFQSQGTPEQTLLLASQASSRDAPKSL